MGSHAAQTTRTLTADLRHHLRAAIDRARRQRITLEDTLYQIARCAGCGCEHTERTTGCSTCKDRWLKRELRKNDEWRVRDCELRTARKQRERSGKRR